MKKYLLIDGNNVLKKCFHIKKRQHEVNVKTKGVYFFLKYLGLFIEKHNPDKIIVFWDGFNGGFYKHQIYPNYKANRKGKSWSSTKLTKKESEDKETFSWQKGRVKSYLDILGIDHIERESIEADDLIGLASQIINHQHIPTEIKSSSVSKNIHNHTKNYTKPFKDENFDDLVLFYETYLRDENDKLYKTLKNLGGVFYINQELFPTSVINKKAIYRAFSNILYNEDNLIKGVKVVIISNDRDFIQLINNNTSLYVTDQNILIDRKFIQKKLNMNPKDIIIQKAIFGDVSDNIEGISGCGDVTMKLFTETYLGKEKNLDQIVESVREDTKNKKIRGRLNKVVTPILNDTDSIRIKHKIIDITNPILRLSDHVNVINLLLNGSKEIDIESFENEYTSDNLIDYLKSASHTAASFLTPFYRHKRKFEARNNYIIPRERTSTKPKDVKVNKRSPYWYKPNEDGDKSYRDWFVDNHGIETVDDIRNRLLAGGRLISCGEESEYICIEILSLLNL